MPGILDKIISTKRKELEEAKKAKSLSGVQWAVRKRRPPRDFRAALRRSSPEAPLRLIAEIKKASPSAGVIRELYDPLAIAREYQRLGADALSVLTDRVFFKGELYHLAEVSEWAPIPVLRKDFIFEEYQLYESRAAGADAILLIVRILSEEQLRRLVPMAKQLALSALVEVHSEAELDRALAAGADMIGINHRNLDTLNVDLKLTEQLAPKIPKGKTVVSESGIGTAEDIQRIKSCGVDAILVGESLLKSKDLARHIQMMKS